MKCIDKNWVAVFFSFAYLFLFSCSTTEGQKKLSPVEFEKQMEVFQEVQLIDVRTADEYNEDHLDNAINIDYHSKDFKAKVASLDEQKPVFVYCALGGRSENAANILKEIGYKEVYDLEGGISAWKNEGMKVVK